MIFHRGAWLGSVDALSGLIPALVARNTKPGVCTRRLPEGRMNKKIVLEVVVIVA